MVVDGAVVMVENIVRHLSHRRRTARHRPESHLRGGPRGAAAGVFRVSIIITAYLPIFTLQAVEGRLFKPMAWTVAFALCGALIFSIWWRRSWPASFPQRDQRVG
jgi:cobalt-zinc-cadmium resistance protein CzcA